MFNDQVYNEIYRTSPKMRNSLNTHNLNRIIQTVDKAISQYGRVLAIRCDLRFANVDPDSPVVFQNNDSAVITRFIESLKSQVSEDLSRKGLQLARVHHTDVPYAWAREQDESIYQHYHVLILLNYNTYAYLGDYLTDSRSLANKIQKAWCSATRLPYPEYASLVHFPERPCYQLFKYEIQADPRNYIDCLCRAAYLVKERTKIRGAGYRTFGCSQ